MKVLQRRPTGLGSWIFFAVLCGVAIAVGIAGQSLATSSPPHTNHYQLIFERTGTQACYAGCSFQVDGITTPCTSNNSPLNIDGSDKKDGDTLGIRFYSSYGNERRAGTLTLKASGSALAVGADGNANITVRVEMSSSDPKRWVIHALIYCT